MKTQPYLRTTKRTFHPKKKKNPRGLGTGAISRETRRGVVVARPGRTRAQEVDSVRIPMRHWLSRIHIHTHTHTHT